MKQQLDLYRLSGVGIPATVTGVIRPYVTPDDAGASISGAVTYRKYRSDADNYFSVSAGFGYSPEVNQFNDTSVEKAKVQPEIPKNKRRLLFYFSQQATCLRYAIGYHASGSNLQSGRLLLGLFCGLQLGFAFQVNLLPFRNSNWKPRNKIKKKHDIALKNQEEIYEVINELNEKKKKKNMKTNYTKITIVKPYPILYSFFWTDWK